MVLASTEKVVLGSIAFAIFWILAVFPAVPFMPIGRTAGSLLGAMLMVIFRVISPEEAYKAIDLPILGLLFGTMVVGVYLERADMFKYLGKLLSWKSRGGKDLLCRICLISAIASALFTNDTCCVVLTEFVLKIANQNNLPPKPFLLALASSANIGSAATPIGNPQNLVIAVQSQISFVKFLIGIIPAMLVGVVVNAAVLLCYYWKHLSNEKDVELELTPSANIIDEEDASSHRFSPATMSHLSSMNSQEINHSTDHHEIQSESKEAANGISPRKNVKNSSTDGRMNDLRDSPEEKMEPTKRWKRLMWKTCVYLVTVGMLVALLLGLNMSWSAITAALALVVLDFRDARPSLEKVSYSLLVFFCGMFITVDGFNKTGIPGALWDLMEPYAHINRASGMVVLALVILLLSNVASNVPTVLLLGARVAASARQVSPAEETKAWLVLAWVSTVAGNLTLLGSAANLIVCEQARRAPLFGYNLSFFGHIVFGVPSTLIVTAIGLFLIRS